MPLIATDNQDCCVFLVVQIENFHASYLLLFRTLEVSDSRKVWWWTIHIVHSDNTLTATNEKEIAIVNSAEGNFICDSIVGCDL